jgi:hypothetical protein
MSDKPVASANTPRGRPSDNDSITFSSRDKTLVLPISICAIPRYYRPVPIFGERLSSLSLTTPLAASTSPLDTRLKPLLIAMSDRIRSYFGDPSITNTQSLISLFPSR